MAFNQKRAFNYLKELTTKFKDRFGGSENEHRAARYIAQHFRAFGLKTYLQVFPVTNYLPRRKSLLLTRPIKGSIPCEMVGLSACTPRNGIEGELAFVDTGEEEYLSPELRGKILLLTGGIPYKRYESILKVKPLGIIIIESEIRRPPVRVEILPEWRKYGSIPMLRISHEDGYYLLRKNVRRVKMVVDYTEKRVRSTNVIGELVGCEKPEEIILIGGHYDTSPGIPGASDNAGGTTLVMELAKIFSQKRSKRTLRFVTWGSEELGLRGSIFYAQRLKQSHKRQKKKKSFRESGKKTELERHLLCVNLDVHGVLLGNNISLVLGPSDLSASVRLLAKELGPAFTVREEVYSSDGTPLSEAGIPSVSFARSGGTSTYLHTPLDNITYLDENSLGMHGRFLETWLERYVTRAVSFPFERTIPEDQKKKIKEYFNERLGLPVE
ncbi:MAG: M28 family peptidase [candidate division WOR-3 bacterium]